jgi:Fe-S-cluster containining protein
MDHRSKPGPADAAADFAQALEAALLAARAANWPAPSAQDGSSGVPAPLARAPSVPAGPDPASLAAAMAQVRVELPVVDSLPDLYALVDDLADGVRAAYPESLCKAGCSGCCHYPAGLFTASRQEWDVILEHVRNHWSPERIGGFVRRFWDTHGRYLARLRAVEWLMEFPLPVNARREAVPLACPFLEDDRCTIYAVRPVYCRCFGQFSFKYWWKREPIVYGCDMQVEHLEPITRQPGRAKLPSFNPLFNKRFALSYRSTRHLLAIWVAKQWPRKWLATSFVAQQNEASVGVEPEQAFKGSGAGGRP